MMLFQSLFVLTAYGLEGDAVTDTESVFQDQQLRNGWENDGLP